MGPLRNPRLLGAVLATSLVQLLLHHLPITQRLFELRPLTLDTAILVLALGLVPASAMELRTLVRRSV